MTNQNGNDVPEGELLSDQEREAFKMVSTGNDLHSQRAIALLAIDDGATQAEAAQLSGLTAGQVKYWLGKFRQVRMEIFPEQVLQAEMPEGEPAQKSKTKKSKGKKDKKKAKKKPKGKKKTNKKGKGKKKKNKK
jgi:hypothetical protein